MGHDEGCVGASFQLVHFTRIKDVSENISLDWLSANFGGSFFLYYPGTADPIGFTVTDLGMNVVPKTIDAERMTATGKCQSVSRFGS
jgi:hypothetical protein